MIFLTIFVCVCMYRYRNVCTAFFLCVCVYRNISSVHQTTKYILSCIHVYAHRQTHTSIYIYFP